MSRRTVPPPRAVCALVALFLGAGPALAHPVNTYVLQPEDDWCGFIDEAWAGGDLILLVPGDYIGPCNIDGKPPQEPEETTTIQSLDTTNPARFVHDGEADHVLRITGEHVALYHLLFEDVPEGVDAVRIEGTGHRYWTRFNTFRNVEGTALRIVGGSGARVRDTRFFDVTGTPVVFGCDDGTCSVGDLLFSGNVFDGATRSVVHPGAWGIVSDNLGARFHGPGLLYAGSGGPGTVEGNLLVGDEVLEIRADDVLVRNNVLVGSGRFTGAIDLLGNSLVGDFEPGTGRFEDNAVVGSLPAEGQGNVACGKADDCFVDAEAWDFRPVEGGPLISAGVDRAELDVDFCGTERASPPDVGALQFTQGGQPLELDLKARQNCAGAPENRRRDDEPDASEEGGCGCASGPISHGAWPWMLLLAGAVRRRRA